jgi:hypothetical protein
MGKYYQQVVIDRLSDARARGGQKTTLKRVYMGTRIVFYMPYFGTL